MRLQAERRLEEADAALVALRAAVSAAQLKADAAASQAELKEELEAVGQGCVFALSHSS